jgi:glycosyltransferase involved in cell wall biosynthesis
MNILMVWARFLPEMGGIETHIHEVSRRLIENGHSITVLATDRSGMFPKHEIVHGIEIIRVTAHPKSKDWYFSPGVFREIWRRRWDVIHVQGYHTFVPLFAMLSSLMSRQKYVLTFHSGGHSSPFRVSLRRLQWALLAPLVKRANALVGVSRSEIEQFSHGMGIPRDRFRLIRNGAQSLHAIAESVPENPNLIISMGRLERYKGHHRVIAAMPEILRQRPQTRLHVIGGGPCEEELKQLVDRLGLGHAVQIFAWDPTDRLGLAKQVASCGLFVLLSDYEAHPVAVMEALGLGRKVLTTDNSGFTELAELGWIATIPEHSDAKQVAKAIMDRLDASRSRAVTLPSWDDAASAILRLYSDVIGR